MIAQLLILAKQANLLLAALYSHKVSFKTSSYPTKMILRSPYPDILLPDTSFGEFVLSRLQKHENEIALVYYFGHYYFT